jgi:hypothetical protein
MDAAAAGFSIGPPRGNRTDILMEAVRNANAGDVTLGSGHGAGPPADTEVAAVLRSFASDRAEFAAFPDVYRITEADFIKRGLPAPVALTALTDKFYWIRFPIGLVPQRGWAFDKLEVGIKFLETDSPLTRAKAHQILPDKKFQEQLNIDTGLTLTLGENLEFQAKGALGHEAIGKADASVDVKGAAKLGVVAGPFQYRFVRAKIDHTSTGMEWVFWRLDGEEFFQENTPDLVVIARVPAAAKELRVEAELRACRYFQYATADLKDVVDRLVDRLRKFFRDEGLAIGDRKEYNLTELL